MKKMAWTIDGRTYFLNPSYTQGSTGRIWVTGCEMYDKDNEYVGFWYRQNMPVNLIHLLTGHVKAYLSAVPKQTRKYTKRKSTR